MKSIKLVLLITSALPISSATAYDGSGQINYSGMIPGAIQPMKKAGKKSSTQVAPVIAAQLPISTSSAEAKVTASTSSKPATPPSPWGETKTPVTDMRSVLAESTVKNAKHATASTIDAQAAPTPIISPASITVELAPAAGAGKGCFDDAEKLSPKIDIARQATPTLSYDSESEKSTTHRGLLPEITKQKSTYRRSVISGCFFDKVFSELKSGKPVDPREIEKASVDARDFPEHYNPIKVAQLLKMIINRPEITLTPATLGELHTICTNAKNSKAIELADLTEKSVRELHALKEGIDNSAKLYATMNGSCNESPKAEYGMGSKFSEDLVKSYQQAIAKAFSTREKLCKDLK